jgi:hypothetical protein
MYMYTYTSEQYIFICIYSNVETDRLRTLKITDSIGIQLLNSFTHTTTTGGLGRGFEPTSVTSYLRRAVTLQGQICKERVREEILIKGNRDLGLGGCLYLFLIYR